MQATVAVQRSLDRRLLIVSAWTAVLLVSDLPDIVWNAISGHILGWSLWIKVAAPCVLLVACLVWKGLRPLWQFACVMLVLWLAFAGSTWVGDTPWWQSRFGGPQVSFAAGYLGLYFRDCGVALAVGAALWLIKRRRDEFFLVKGDLRAPIEPVRWLGIRRGESWRTFGWIFAVAAGACVMIPTVLSMPLSSAVLLRAAPLLPAGILFSAINAFNEEIYFRASLLSTLPGVVGRRHAMLLTVTLFGLAHWLYGSPAGLVGFLMTGFLAWLLAKSMLETRGLLWPWFIHFVPDTVVFASYAILFVQ